MGAPHEASPQAGEAQQQGGWPAFQIENEPAWQNSVSVSGAFTLDDDEEPLLHTSLGGAAAATTPDSPAAPAGPRGHLPKSVSRFTLLTEADEDSWKAYRHEAGRITQLALPMTISQFLAFALSLISVAFVGRLGEEDMAVAVLATSMMNVTGFSLVLGFLGALDTLCGQAWGAKNYRALGTTLQKAVVTTLLTSAAVCLLWAHMGWLMLAVGQQERIASGAARFLQLGTPALICAGMFECLKRYLMAQGIVKPVTVVSCGAVALAPLFNWLLIFKAGLGLDGAVYAMDACHFSMLCMLFAYYLWHERRRLGTPEQTWHGWTRDCVKGLGAYYKLAIPSTLMVCLEWWAYELTIIMSGWLPSPTLHVAVMGVMLQVSGFCYMLPSGLSCATSVRVSNALGAGLPRAARRSARAAAVLVACTQATMATVLVLGREHWGAAFTNLPDVISTAAAVFPVMAATMFGDGMNATIGCMLRGAGRQELGALLNLCSYWGLGLPIAYLLAFKAGWGIRGLWTGLALCTSVQGVIMLVVLLRFNWQQAAAEAEELASASAIVCREAACALAACEDSAAKLHPTRAATAAGGGGGRGSSSRGAAGAAGGGGRVSLDVEQQ